MAIESRSALARPRRQKQVPWWIFSPQYIACISVAGSLLWTFFPPGVYESVMGEPNFMFSDLQARIFVLACLASFITGTAIARCLRGFRHMGPSFSSGARFPEAVPSVFYLAMLLIAFSIGLILYRVAQVRAAVPESLILLASGMGHLYRQELHLYAPGLKWAFDVAHAIIIWSWYRCLSLSGVIAKGAQRPWLAANLVASLTYVAGCAILLARFKLFPFAISLLFVAAYWKWRRGGLRFTTTLKLVLASASVLVGLFVLFSFLRGARGGQLVESLFGYGPPACYNRLSALLTGYLTMPDSGSGFYTFTGLWDEPPIVHRFVDTTAIGRSLGLALPESRRSNWEAQFASISLARLDGRFIYPSAFGYVFCDLGWWSLAYFFVYGMLCRSLFLQFLVGRTFGVVLYPLAVFAIVFWFGDNYFVYSSNLGVAESALLIGLCERVLVAGRGVVLRPAKPKAFGTVEDHVSTACNAHARADRACKRETVRSS